MGLIENYDAAIASLEREIADCERRAKRFGENAVVEQNRASDALAQAARLREFVREMREPRGELVRLYPAVESAPGEAAT